MGLPMLKQRRKEMGLSQSALGAMLEPPVTGQTIYNWESGERNPDVLTLRRLAAALNTTVGALLGELPTSAGGAA